MNEIIQMILVAISIILAVGFLVKTFLPKKASSKKSCGNGDNCGCH